MSDTISPQNGWFPVGGQQQNRAMLVTGILSLCIVSFIFIILHFYVRYVLCRRNDPISILRDGAGAGACGPPELAGLDLKVIAALPTFAYHPTTNRCGSSGEEEEAPAAECAVCLSVVEEGEVVRLLPNCSHVFHVDCIDVWLHSHPTCPVCRADAVPSEAGKATVPPPPVEVYSGGGPSGPALEGMPDSKEGVSVTSRLGSSLRRMWSRERSERRIQMDGVEDLEGQY